jgi:outer membrane protein
MLKKLFFTTLLLVSSSAFTAEKASDSPTIGIVNFATCVNESKYGKYEQEQLESIRQQWVSLIEETNKEIQALSTKFEDKEYMEGLSPQAEQEMKEKYATLSNDASKYQNQLYQTLNQANYFFIQKMLQNISKAADKIAAEQNLTLVVNKEACFSYNSKMEITEPVISQMDKNFAQDVKDKKITLTEKKETTDKVADNKDAKIENKKTEEKKAK